MNAILDCKSMRAESHHVDYGDAGLLRSAARDGEPRAVPQRGYAAAPSRNEPAVCEHSRRAYPLQREHPIDATLLTLGQRPIEELEPILSPEELA